MPETQVEHGPPTLEIRPNQVFPGQRIVVRGSGWSGSPIDLFFDGAHFTPARALEGTLQNGELRPDAQGNFVVFLHIPSEVKSGRNQVRAVGRERQEQVQTEVVQTGVEPQAVVFAAEDRIPIDKPGERNRQLILERFGTEAPSLPITRLLIREEVGRIRRERDLARSELGPAIAAELPGCNWTPVGPSVVPNGQLVDPSLAATAPVSGRVTAIAIDPNDPNNTIYVGAAQGGVWKSTDGGATWFSKTDFQASLAIGTITIDASVTDASTGHSNRIYVGTGEENFNFDAYYGAGVLRSDDGGETWTQLAADTLKHDKISRIIIDPSDNTHVYLACDAGVFESTDTGASWTSLRAGIATDLALDASHTANERLYAAFKGEGIFLRIGIGGFTQLTSPNLPNPAPGRIALALCAGQRQTIYAAIADTDNPGTLHNIYSTTDAGTTWNALPSVPPSVKSVWYNLVLAVHPTDAHTLYFGEVHLWRSTDAGANWTDVSVISGSSQGVHADQHAFALHPTTPTTVWAGNDGGIWLSTDGGSSWRHRNRGLQTMQYYTIAQHPRWEAVILAGAQDNGAQRYSGHPAMLLSAPGDGGYTAIDPSTPSRWYEGRYSLQNQHIFGVYRSDQAGTPGSWNRKTTGINVADRVQFYAPFAIDPSNPSTLYFGTHRLYQTTNNADSWNAITGDLTGGGPREAISAITVASATIVYAGSSQGHFSRVELSGGTWTATDHSAGLPRHYISDIAVDPANASTIYVTISKVFTGDHVWRSTDGGATWTSASLGLSPRNPVNCIDVDPATPNRIFIGCDVGIFRSEDQGGTWVEWDQGLPDVAVFDIRVHTPSRLLRAATHGRGIWERPIDASDCPAVDIYLRDNIVDIARTIPTSADVQDPFTGLTTSWDQSVDIKVDTPDSGTNQFHTATSTLDYIDFQSLDQCKPRGGATSRLYVQVHNRGVNVASTVQVRPFWADTSTSLPNLPSDFWTAFPANDPGGTSVWHPIGPALSITNLRPGEPQVVEWDWPVPSSAPNQVGVLAAITSTDDLIAETGLDVSSVVPGNKHIALKRMQVDGAG